MLILTIYVWKSLTFSFISAIIREKKSNFFLSTIETGDFHRSRNILGLNDAIIEATSKQNNLESTTERLKNTTKHVANCTKAAVSHWPFINIHFESISNKSFDFIRYSFYSEICRYLNFHRMVLHVRIGKKVG